MRSHLLAFATAAFLLNPNACSSPDPEYQYGEIEMRAAVEGTWDVTVTTPEGTTAEFSVLLKQGTAFGPTASSRGATPRSGKGFLGVREAKACGTRSFVAPAEACIDSSEMPLTVQFLEGDTALGNTPIWDGSGGTTALFGSFTVHSLIFQQGYLSLTLGSVKLNADVREDGTVLEARRDVQQDGEVALKRRE
jgi:hypothetical protein